MRPEASSNHPSASHDAPLSPEVERVRRKLMRLMVVTLIITFMLVAVVLVAVIYKATQPSKQATSEQVSVATPLPISSATFIEQELELDAHTRLISHTLHDPIIAFETLRIDGNREFIFYDYRQGRIISRLKISPP